MTDRETNRLDLYPWQRAALAAWRSNGHRGVIEAVTGTGKTRVGIAAIREARQSGLKSLVLVPSQVLMEQWVRAIEELLPGLTVGRWGHGHYGALADCDVVVAVVNSAVKHLREMRFMVGLLVADECHHYGASKHAKALVPARWRLGLTATLERSDDGVDRVLLPYFERVVHRVGYGCALADGIVSEFEVDLMAVDFVSIRSRRQYESLTEEMDDARTSLIRNFGYPANPSGLMARIAKRSQVWRSPEGRLGSQYVTAFNERRNLLAREPGKLRALRDLAPEILASGRCLVFTQVREAAELVAITLCGAGLKAVAIHAGLTASQCRKLIKDFEEGEVQVLVAPQMLDEGVDLPDADLGIIVGASRSRRQMIQRMGRILRLKPDGRLAKFVILYMEGTSEDPATGAHEAFLEEVLPHALRVTDPQLLAG